MKIYKTTEGIFIESAGKFFLSRISSWDSFINRQNFYRAVEDEIKNPVQEGVDSLPGLPLAPIESQEIWAAGVTYLRSRDARKEESKSSGGGSFYDLVYDAVRPELFFKSLPHRCVGPGSR